MTFKSGSTTALVYAFDASQEMVESKEAKLDALRQASGGAATSEVLSEALNLLGHQWLRQTGMTRQMLLGMIGKDQFWHHRFGRVAQDAAANGGFYVDVGMQAGSTTLNRVDGLDADASPDLVGDQILASALEHGIIEQSQPGAKAASTVKLVSNNNATSGSKTFLATSANWNSIQGQMTGYSTAEMDTIQQNYLNQGYTVILPDKGNLPADPSAGTGRWEGSAYLASRYGMPGLNDTSYMVIGGTWHGGYSSVTGGFDTATYSNLYGTSGMYINTQGSLVLLGSHDPIDLASGHYYYDAADLTIGGGALPRGISFARHYHGVRRYQRSPLLGYGWTHSLDIRINERSEGEITFGAGTVQDAVTMFMGIYAVWDILKNRNSKADGTAHATRPHDYLAAMLVANWAVNQLTGNTAAVALSDRVVEFRRQPDGSYLPPGGNTMTLEKSAATGNRYVLKERHGNTYAFDADNRLETATDLWNKSATFTYTGSGTDKLLDTVTDCYGRSLTLNYENAAEAGKRRISSITDSTGRTVSYRYDDAGNPAGYTNPAAQDNLTQVTDADNLNTWLLYDGEHRIVRLFDHDHTAANDRTIVANEYDSESRVVRQRGYGTANKTWFYYYAPGITVEEDPGGIIYPLFAPPLMGPLQYTEEYHSGATTYKFDEDGRNTAIIDAWGNEKLKFYDGQSRLYAEQTPLTTQPGTTTKYRQTFIYTYDTHHNLIRKDDVWRGIYETSSYDPATDVLLSHADANGNTTTYSNHTAQFQPQTITDPTNVVSKLTYVPITGADSAGAGAVKTEVVMIGGVNVTRATYSYAANGYGNPTTVSYPAQAGGSSASVTTSYTVRGDVDQVLNGRSITTAFTYNNRRQQTGSTIQHTDYGSLSSSSILDSGGHATSTTNFRGFTTTATYSSQGKLLTTSLPLPGSPAITNHYDSRDWLQSVEDPLAHSTSNRYDAAGRRTAVINPLNKRTESLYDELGRAIRARNPLGHGSNTNYGFYSNAFFGGTLTLLPDATRAADYTETVDSLNRRSFQFFDSLGKLRASFLPSPAGTMTIQGSQPLVLWQFTYDTAGRPRTTVRPGGGVFETQYDTAGRLKKTIKPSGIFTEVNYDGRDFIDTRYVKSPNGGAGINLLGYTHRHDANGNQLSLTEDTYNAAGTAVTSTQTVVRTFDNQDRVRTFTDAHGQLIGYRYDKNGSLEKILYPDATPADWSDNPAVTYTYDAMDRLKTVTDWRSRTTTYTWDDAGRLRSIQRPNGTTRTLTPDAAGQTLTVMERNGTGHAFLYLRFGYDAAGRIEKRLIAPPPQNGVSVAAMNATHTSDNRISGHPYDDDGNLGTAFRLTSIGGALLNAEAGTQLWTAKSELRAVRHNSAAMGGTEQTVTQCRYDPEGRLINLQNGRATSSGGTPTWTLDDTVLTISPASTTGLSQVLVRDAPERNAPATRRLTRYVYGLGLLYEVTDNGTADGDVLYYHGDQVGSTLAMTDASGTVQARFEYTPYGVLTRATIPNNHAGASQTPYLFCGESGCYTDAASGLVHMRARWYNPWLCRFLNEDPIGFEGGMNWFAYAGGDPLMRSDPSGLSPAWQISNPAGYWDPSVRAMEQSAEYKEGYRQGMGTGAIAGLAIAAAVFAPELYAAYPAATTVGAAGVTLGVAGQGASDLYRGSLSGANEYIGAGVGGGVMAAGTFVSGGTAPTLLTMVGWGAGGAAAGNLVEQGLSSKPFSTGELLWDTGFGAASGFLGNFGGPAVSGFTSGRGSWLNVANTQLSRHFNGTAVNMSATTAGKIFGTQVYGSAGNILLDGLSDATKSDFFLPRK